MSNLLVIRANPSLKRVKKNSYFSYVFDRFSLLFPFLCPRALAQWLFFKERRERFAHCCSLQKSNCERIAQIALYKRATVSNLLQSLMTKEQRERFALFHKKIVNIIFYWREIPAFNSAFQLGPTLLGLSSFQFNLFWLWGVRGWGRTGGGDWWVI